MNVARRWFAEGRAGNVALADDLFSGNVRTNGVPVGVAGPKRRIQQRLAACPDLTTTIEDMLSAHDNIVRGLSGTERYRPIWGVKATAKPTEVRDFAVWRFEAGKVAGKSQ